MKMTRIVYHIDGNDYNGNDTVTVSFNVLAVSIQNFIYLVKQSNCHVSSFGPIFTDGQRTTTNGDMKTFKIIGFAKNIVTLAKKLGKKDWDTLNDNWDIRNTELRAYNGHKSMRYNGYSVFDPVAKTITFKSNSPAKITGRQAIINGKLWRKYYTASMR